MDSDKELDDFNFFVKEYLHKINDLELLILKGHNLVEYTMNRYIEDLVMRPEQYYKLNLTFAEKLGIMKFMTVIHLVIFERLTLLNKVRNELSHKLHPDTELINTFLLQCSYGDNLVKQYFKTEKVLALKYAIRNICVQLNFGRIGAKLANYASTQKKIDEFMKQR